MRGRRGIVVAALVALVVGLVAGWWIRGQMQIDGCLDAGGRWIHERGFCEGRLEP